jgi:hypothetical protein
MGHFVPALNGPSSCPPMGHDQTRPVISGRAGPALKYFGSGWAWAVLFSVLRAGPSGPAQMYTYSPWVVAGDFNQIFCSENKNNTNINRSMMGRFRRFINDMGLKDIPLVGRKYTWSNERSSPTLVKLDHLFCTACWEQLYLDCIRRSNATRLSDHCSLILSLKEDFKGKSRFHFESFWTKIADFLDVVADSWVQPVQTSCPLKRISLKLRRLARSLQSWGHKNAGNVKSQLALAKEILHRLEMAQDSRLLSFEELWLLRRLKQHCLALASLDRTAARLRSRVRYLKEGDANTSFFHLQACYRKKRNFISSLTVGDRVATSHEQKHEALNDFYTNLLGVAKHREFPWATSHVTFVTSSWQLASPSLWVASHTTFVRSYWQPAVGNLSVRAG